MEEHEGDKIFNKAVIAKDEVKEPLIAYTVEPKPRRLTISTLAGQEENNYLYWLNLTPGQRIANATELIQRVYADQLSLPSKKDRIIFDKP